MSIAFAKLQVNTSLPTHVGLQAYNTYYNGTQKYTHENLEEMSVLFYNLAKNNRLLKHLFA